MIHQLVCADVVAFDLLTGTITLGDVISDPTNDFLNFPQSSTGSDAVIDYTFLQPPQPGSLNGVVMPPSQAVQYVETIMRLQFYAILSAYGSLLPSFGPSPPDEGCWDGCAKPSLQTSPCVHFLSEIVE